jgi:hypothetical protein
MQIQLSVGEGGFSLTTLILHHFFWLSETRIWISIAICRGLCCYEKKVYTFVVNSSTNNNKTSSHTSCHTIEHNTAHDILRWIFRSWFRTVKKNDVRLKLLMRTPPPPGALEFKPGFQWDSCYSIFSFMCMFVDRCLSFVFWPLCCLFFFDVQILITPLVSSNSSDKKY